MKPARFEYAPARSVEDALALLVEGAGEAKVLAGGQSLMPMLNFRLLEPSLLVDINPLAELDFVRPAAGGGLRLGALTRHRTLETSAMVREHAPLLTETVRHVAHLAVRNRGTLAGSLCHADPSAELPLAAVLLDAEIVTASPAGGRRIPASEFFEGPLDTALEEAEIVVEIALPAVRPGTGFAFAEVTRRAGDFAMAAAAVALTSRRGRCVEARVGLGGVGDTPLRSPAAEAFLLAEAPGDGPEGWLAGAAAAAESELDPPDDLHASAEFRRHLAGVLTRRALGVAWSRALGDAA